MKAGCAMKFQLIMHRLMEPDKDPNITCGTLEGTLLPGPTTLFRLQGAADGGLRSYIAEGHILDADPQNDYAKGVRPLVAARASAGPMPRAFARRIRLVRYRGVIAALVIGAWLLAAVLVGAATAGGVVWF